jgi:hypothetical protein
MRQRVKEQQCLRHVCDAGSFAEISAVDLRPRRSEQAPALRMAFTPAAQGHLAAVEQVPTAAAFSSVCNGVRATGRPPATLVAPRQDHSLSDDEVWEPMRINWDRLWLPRRRTSFTNRFSFCPASQGKVAVVGPVPAAATSFVSAERRGRAVDTVRGGPPR